MILKHSNKTMTYKKNLSKPSNSCRPPPTSPFFVSYVFHSKAALQNGWSTLGGCPQNKRDEGFFLLPIKLTVKMRNIISDAINQNFSDKCVLGFTQTHQRRLHASPTHIPSSDFKGFPAATPPIPPFDLVFRAEGFLLASSHDNTPLL